VRFPEFYSWQRRWWHKAMMPKTLFRRANRVIAVSRTTAWDLEDLYGINPRKIRVVPSGIKQSELGTSEQEVRRKYNLPQRFWLFLGVWEPRKNIESLVRAFEAVADRVPVDLVLAGSSGWLDQDLKKRLDESLVKTRIHQLGFVSEQDKRGLYEAAELFVYPSFYEGFGFPPLEAMIAGTPAVVARAGSMPEVAGDWATMVDPYNTNELAQVLEELAFHPRRVPESTRRMIKERYTWKETAQKTLGILEEVCE
jgi:glycosyltransferase involved in cell wall biosynthesis